MSLVAVTLGELAGSDFRLTEVSFVSMRQRWAYAGGIATAPFLCQFLTACLATVITWLCAAAGVTLVVLLRLSAICVGVGGAIVALSVIRGSYITLLHISNGNSQFDDHQSNETVIQHEISTDNTGISSVECSICFGTFGDNAVRTLQCSHTFHLSCITQWAVVNQTCPICRAPVN